MIGCDPEAGWKRVESLGLQTVDGVTRDPWEKKRKKMSSVKVNDLFKSDNLSQNVSDNNNILNAGKNSLRFRKSSTELSNVTEEGG